MIQFLARVEITFIFSYFKQDAKITLVDHRIPILHRCMVLDVKMLYDMLAGICLPTMINEELNLQSDNIYFPTRSKHDKQVLFFSHLQEPRKIQKWR